MAAQKPVSNLPERVAVVTGAGDGIGWATAKRLAQEFAHVVIADVRPEAAEQRAAELGAGHLGLGCDVTSEASVVALMQQVHERFGRIDVLVNNAGIGEQPVMTLEQTVDAFDRILAVHLRGTFLASREVGRIFVQQQSGAIVNISSIAGLQGHPGRNAYGAAKAGISTMTSAMASEWARDGIRVNAVAPGYVLTDLVKNLAAKGALDLEDLERCTPMGAPRGNRRSHRVSRLRSRQLHHRCHLAGGRWLGIFRRAAGQAGHGGRKARRAEVSL